MPTTSEQVLLGRHRECAALGELLSAARAGTSQVLVLRGEPGCGKSALLGYVADQLRGWRTLTVSGVESETELAYSGLHQLCMPLTERLDRLPTPRRDALATVFGMSAHAAPDRFLVALATLTLLADAAEEEPLACVVDDLQWLDQASAQVLSFVARRLFHERIALVCAARTGASDAVMARFPTLHVGGLDDPDARALLAAHTVGRWDAAVVDQMIAESRGNPQALLEVARMWSALDAAGGYNLPDSRPSSHQGEQRYAQILAGLPADTQLLLAVAAAEPLGERALLERAATELGLHLDAAAPAIDAELIAVGERVLFTHPCARSAVYRASTRDDRHRAHRALADATDAESDPDRRAWHRARATKTANEIVAGELERAAPRAGSRGGLAATGAFLARAVELTPDHIKRGERAVAAAAANLYAGGFDEARRMVSIARDGSGTTAHQVQIDTISAQLAFAARGSSDAPGRLLAAARGLESVDVALARDIYRDAVAAALLAGRFTLDPSLAEVAHIAHAAPSTLHADPTGADLLLDGLTALADDHVTDTSVCKAALAKLGESCEPRPDQLRALWQGTVAALEMWDADSAHLLSARHIDIARGAGALGELALGLSLRTTLLALSGEFSAALTGVADGDAIEDTTGIACAPYGALTLAALRGHSATARHLINSSIYGARSHRVGVGVALGDYAWAVLCNGSGHYDDALGAAQSASAYREIVAENLALPELVEAAARAGHLDIARAALERLTDKTRACGTAWAAGVAARSRALVSDHDSAEDLYREAILTLSRTPMRCDLARSHLLYGEWLRRAQRTRDAKATLTVAYEMFTAMTMDGFAERARRELHAIGTKIHVRTVQAQPDLTAQEAQIARLAENGLSNAEIGAQLFISARTVEWHLRKVFTKLGITSRRQLRCTEQWHRPCPAGHDTTTAEAG